MRKILVMFSLLLMVAGIAQTQDLFTPTPAPSKTPTPTLDWVEDAPPETTPDAEAAEIADDDDANADLDADDYALARAFTQEDLQVLVGNVQRPNGFTYLDGNLYAACTGDWTLYEIDSRTGDTITFVHGIYESHTLYAEETSEGFNLWLPDFQRNELSLVTHTRARPRQVVGGLEGPWGIAPLENGDFLVSNLRANNLVQISREGDLREVMTGLRAPAGLVIEGDYGYVVNNGSARRAIEWFSLDDLDPDTSVEDITQPLVQGLQNASGMVLADDGYLYFTYALGTRGIIGRVMPEMCREEGCTNDEVEIVVYTELNAPLAGLTITPDFRLFVHTIYQPVLYWVSLYGES